MKHLKLTHKYKGSSKTITNSDADQSFFKEDKELDQYMVEELRGQKRGYKCSECNKTFARLELKYHLNFHKNVKPYKCIVGGCSNAYYSPHTTAKHVKKVHNLSIKATQWSLFNNFGDPSILEPSESVSAVEIMTCEVCGEQVSTKKLKKHLANHNESKNLVCPKEGCGKQFRLKFKLKTHMETHSKENISE